MRNGSFALRVAAVAIGATLPLSPAWSEAPAPKSNNRVPVTEKRNRDRESRMERKLARMHKKDQEMDRLMNQRKTRPAEPAQLPKTKAAP